jgi:hypothetical protein
VQAWQRSSSAAGTTPAAEASVATQPSPP